MSRLALFACLLPALATAAPAPHRQDDPPTAPLPPVRVHLVSLGSLSRVTLRAEGDLKVLDGETGETLAEGAEVTLSASGEQVSAASGRAAWVRVEGTGLAVQGGKTRHAYPGALLVRGGKRGLALEDECSLDDYVAGVLAGECPALFHPEAIRAMAVAVRSYSYRRAYLGKVELCDTTHCQLFHGSTVPATLREAVAATAGQVALSEGAVIDAVYSSDCGGYTEANDEVWKGTKPLPYLRAVEDAPEPEGEPYCLVNRSHAWTVRLSPARLQSLFGKAAPSLTLEVLETTESGRVRRLQLAPVDEKAAGDGSQDEPPAEKPGAKVFSGAEWRRLLGAPLKSLKFDVRETEDGVELAGTGWGHGAGLCQYGANGMARQGVPYAEILQHYYTGVELGPAPPVESQRALAARKVFSMSDPGGK